MPLVRDMTTSTCDVDCPAAMIAETIDRNDRRRPLRMASVNPALILLFRGETAQAVQQPKFLSDNSHEDNPIKGLAVSVGFSTVLWGFLGSMGWLIMH